MGHKGTTKLLLTDCLMPVTHSKGVTGDAYSIGGFHCSVAYLCDKFLGHPGLMKVCPGLPMQRCYSFGETSAESYFLKT